MATAIACLFLIGSAHAAAAQDDGNQDPGRRISVTGGMVVALWDRARLAEDSGVEDTGRSGGFTLAYNAREPSEVDAVIDEVRAAGGTITREPGETFWGGYSAAFADPDGHPWEVAHNPRWTITDDGRTLLAPE